MPPQHTAALFTILLRHAASMRRSAVHVQFAASVESTGITYCGDLELPSGQGRVVVPNCRGTGCRAGGLEDCAWCVFDMVKCKKWHGDVCEETHNARRAQGINGCGFSSDEEKAYRNLQAILHPFSDGAVDLDNAMKQFRGFKPLFAKDGVSESSWNYAWSHLPSIIMDHPRIKYVLHAADDHYKSDAPGIYTFSGWDAEGGAFLDHTDNCREAAGCTVHVNLRDVYTDIDEFMSNLLLHINFLQDQHVESITICRDQEDPERSCRHRGDCTLSLAETCTKAWSKAVSYVPTYTVELKGMNQRAILDSLTDKWLAWAKEVKNAAMKVSKCSSDRLRVHLVQGATQALWLMTSKFAMDYKGSSNMTLRGNYGGPYEEQDRKYARLIGDIGRSSNWALGKEVNAMNGDMHAYVSQSGPYSVNTETISLEGWAAGEVDPIVTPELLAATVEERACAVLVNVGYAFGSSALPMGLALNAAFGSALQSFYVIGKAGGLVGKLGDYQVASQVPLWNESMAAFHELEKAPSSDVIGPIQVDESLWSSAGSGSIHKGPVVSVPAVVLESDVVLEHLKGGFSQAVGVEMEGHWFHQAFPNLKGLYIYYTSDLPLVAESNLAHEDTSLFAEEGQCLFNGLVRMVFKHMLEHVLPKAKLP